MAKSRFSKQVEDAVQFLPEDGSELTHDAWKQAIVGAGKYNLIPAMQKARRENAVAFRLQVDTETDEQTLMVSRMSAGKERASVTYLVPESPAQGVNVVTKPAVAPAPNSAATPVSVAASKGDA